MASRPNLLDSQDRRGGDRLYQRLARILFDELATRNAAMVMTLENYWRVRSTSPECALLHDKARSAKVRPVVSEHSAIAVALRARDPVAARAAMRAHLSAVMEHLLFTTEKLAVEEARRTAATTRERYRAAAQA